MLTTELAAGRLDAIAALSGDGGAANKPGRYSSISPQLAFHRWIFGGLRGVSNTLVVFSRDQVVIVTSRSKVRYFAPLNAAAGAAIANSAFQALGSPPEVVLMTRSDAAALPRAVAAVTGRTGRPRSLGVFDDLGVTGQLVGPWADAISKSPTIRARDLTRAAGMITACKDSAAADK